MTAVSAVLIVQNNAPTIAATLDSLRDFDEVILYANNSSDDTETIAKDYPNARWIEGYFDGFGTTKQRAVEAAKNAWIFSIDSDEIITPALLAAIHDFDFNDTNNVGIVTRANQFYGKTITVGGWGHDHLLRLFNRETHHFDDKVVHESVPLTASSQEIHLQGELIHHAVTDISQLLIKTERYTRLNATRLKRKPFAIIVLKTGFAFFRSYILQRGFTAGWRGFTIAYYIATDVYFKYLRAYLRDHS